MCNIIVSDMGQPKENANVGLGQNYSTHLALAFRVSNQWTRKHTDYETLSKTPLYRKSFNYWTLEIRVMSHNKR